MSQDIIQAHPIQTTRRHHPRAKAIQRAVWDRQVDDLAHRLVVAVNMHKLVVLLVIMVIAFFVSWYLAIKFAMIAIAFVLGISIGYMWAKINASSTQKRNLS